MINFTFRDDECDRQHNNNNRALCVQLLFEVYYGSLPVTPGAKGGMIKVFAKITVPQYDD